MGKAIEQTLSVLTGVVGDYLAQTDNPLGEGMTLVARGQPLACTAATLKDAYPQANGHLVLLIHGLMATETCFEGFGPPKPDYATLLAQKYGWTPLRLRFNTGQSVAKSAAELVALLQNLQARWPAPIDEIALICHSMGGLVARQALHLLPQPHSIRRIAYLATPHAGAPLERGGRWLSQLLRKWPDPVVRLVGDVAELRSQGIRDLGEVETVPFSPVVEHLLVGSTLSAQPHLARWLGDGMVSLQSATGTHAQPLPSHVQARALTGIAHANLACDPQVAALLVDFLALDTSPMPLSDAAVAETPSTDAQTNRRIHGILRAAADAVVHGNRAIARVRVQRGEQVFAVARRLPGLHKPVQVIKTVHDTAIAASHLGVQVVAEVVRDGLKTP